MYDPATLPEDAFALRPVRIIGGRLREYEAITFPGNPRGGCDLYLRRLLSQVRDDGAGCLIDVLNEDGDIICDYPVTRVGFNRLRKWLGFKRVA